MDDYDHLLLGFMCFHSQPRANPFCYAKLLQKSGRSLIVGPDERRCQVMAALLDCEFGEDSARVNSMSIRSVLLFTWIPVIICNDCIEIGRISTLVDVQFYV